MAEFDLTALINQTLDATDSADPVVVAGEVLAAIPTKQMRAAFSQVLPHYVSAMATRRRASALAGVPEKGDQVGSRRWSAASELLNQPVSTPDGWKHLRECTFDDLIAAAANRRAQATGLVRQAEKLEALADLLLSKGAATVGDLDGDDVTGALAA